MRAAILALIVGAFPSVQIGMTRADALAALKKDSLTVCESERLDKPDPLLGGAVSGVVACRACPCPEHLASLIVWFSATERVTSIGVAQPRKPRPGSGR